jgi:hypothetical protein
VPGHHYRQRPASGCQGLRLQGRVSAALCCCTLAA